MPSEEPNNDLTRVPSRTPVAEFGVYTQVQVSAPAYLIRPDGVSAVAGYELSREIARGGMGVVYAARDVALDREVAVKVMLPGMNAAEFDRESRITARLPHPGVPPVHALGALPDGRPFLAMKLIKGETLDKLLRARTDPSEDRGRFVVVFEQMCQAVGYAHARGIIHRDLKPSNVMVGAFGEVQVMDWGLAKVIGGTDTPDAPVPDGLAPAGAFETVAGEVKGTPAYMAPEQARCEDVGPPADVFALGGILAAMLTGNPPFVGDTALGTVLMAAQAELGVCFSQLDACAADAELVAVAKRCLAGDAGARFTDGRAVAEAVVAYRTGVEARLRRAERDRAVHETEAREQRKRRKVQLALVASVLLIVIGGGSAAWWQDRQTTARNAKAEREEADRRETAARLEGERDAEARNKASLARARVRANRALSDDLREQGKFKQADAALGQALDLAKDGAPELLAGVERARADLEFVAQLDDIRYRKWEYVAKEDGKGDFNTKIAAPEYRKVFTEHGLDLKILDPTEAAKQLAESAVKPDLLAAIDDWALYTLDEATRKRLLEIARRADDHTWTARLRDLAVWKDKAALEKLAAEADLARTAPAALTVLAKLMERRGADPVPLLTAARAKYPTSFELAFALGLWHMREKDGKQLGPFEAARALRPENFAVWGNLGNALRDGGDLDGSIAAYREAIKINPKIPGAHHNLGLALRDKKDLDGSIAAHREAIKLDPKFVAAHNDLGIVLHDKKDLDGAIAAYREAIKLDPKYVNAHSNLGNALRDKKNPDEAITAYREAIKLDPKHVNAHNGLGNALRDKKDLDGAIAAYRETIKLNPKYVNAHFNLGLVLRTKGDLDGAIAALRETIKLDPKHFNAHYNLGIALGDKKDSDGAIAAFQEAIRIDPKHANAHDNLGVVLKTQGDLDGAIVEFREAIKLDPNYANAYSNLGITLRTKGDLDGAIAALREAIKLNPKHVNAHYNLGIALRTKGDLDGTIAAYRETIKLDPKHVSAHGNLGLALRDQGDLDGAIAALREAIKLDPKHFNSHNGLGVALAGKADLDGAIAEYREAIKINPSDAFVHSNLGIALRDQGDLDGAIAAFREALKLNPKHPSAARLLARSQRFQELLPRLPDVLAGKTKLTPLGLCEFARLCAQPFQKRFAASVRLYEEAFRVDPKLVADQVALHRYSAACCAARAGRGEGVDAPPAPAERALLRAKALGWLRADLDLHKKQATAPSAAERKTAADKTAQWLKDSELSGVRHPFRLVALPADEVKDWLEFWAEVRNTRDEAQKPIPAAPPLRK